MTTKDTTTQSNWFRRLTASPVFEGDAAKTRAARFLNIIALVMIPGLMLYGLIVLIVRPAGIALWTLLLGFGMTLIMWAIIQRGRIYFAALFFIVSMMGFITLVVYQQGSIRAPIVSGYVIIIVIATLVLGRRGGSITTAVILAVLFGMTTAELNGLLPPPNLSVTYVNYGTLVLLFVIVSVLLIVWSSVSNVAFTRLETDERRLKAQNIELTELQTTLEERVAQRTQQLEASAEVGRAAASVLDQRQLLGDIVHLITEQFHYYYAGIFTLDETGNWLVLRAGSGTAGKEMVERGHRLSLGAESMVGTAVRSRQPHVVQRITHQLERYDNPLLPETQAEIALPLLVGDRVLGVLDVQATQSDAFDQNTTTVLQTMADQIAIAYSNTLQFEQTQANLKQTERLYQASVAIAEAANAANALQVLVGANIASIDRALLLQFPTMGTPGHWTSAKVGGSWMRFSEDWPIPIGMQLPAEYVPFINHVTPTRPLIIQDIDDMSVDAGYRESLNRLNTKALMALSLNAGSTIIGVLVLAFHEPRSLTTRDVQPFQALATQIAATLYNRQLVAETRAAVQQLDEANRRLTGQAWQEFTRGSQTLRQIDMAPGLAIMQGAGPLPNQLEAPVTLRNAVIGTLRVEDTQSDRVWTPDERALLQAVANDLSLALENQRLIEETEKRAQRERLVAEISSRMFAQNDLETIIEIAATELGRALQVSRAEVRIGAEALAAATPQMAPESGNGQSQEAQS